MSEKGTIDARTVVEFGLIGLVFLVGIAGVIANYMTISDKNNTIQTLGSQINDLQASIASYEDRVTDLQNQINDLKAPKLIAVNLKSDDNRLGSTPYLHIYGEVCNVGTNTAYNCTIHVIAYQSGTIAINKDIMLGIISGGSWTSVDWKLDYNGTALTNWTTSLDWTR